MSLEEEIKQFADFADFGVASVLEDLQDRIKDEGQWKDFNASATGETLLEAIAFISAKLRYMLVREAQEAYLTTAQRRSSVLENTQLLDFNPDRRVWSEVDLRFFLGSSNDNDIVIPQYLQVSHDGTGISFFTKQQAILQTGLTEVTVEAAQGTVNTTTVISSGEKNQSIHLPSDIIAEDGVTVTVDGEQWKIVDSLLKALEDTDDFESVEIDSRPDETLDVEFGDGVRGKIPPAGDEIEVTWIETLGADGIITESDSITNIDGFVTDVKGFQVDLEVTNDDNTATGGAEKQSINDIKVNAPDIFQTGDRAVTRTDYNVIAKDYPSVLLANAKGERNADPPNPTYSDRVELFIVRERDQNGDPQPVTDEWAFGTSDTATLENPDPDTFLSFFNEKKDVDTVVDPTPAGIARFFVSGTVFTDPSNEPTQVSSEVLTALKEYLLVENNVGRNIGDVVRESIVRNQVDELDNVEFHHLHLVNFARAAITSTNPSFGLSDFEASGVNYELLPPFSRESISVLNSNGAVIANDDGDGNLVATSSASKFASGTVDYEDDGSWELTMNFNEQPDEVFRFDFRTADPDDPEKGKKDGDLRPDDNQYPLYDFSEDSISVKFDFEG